MTGEPVEADPGDVVTMGKPEHAAAIAAIRTEDDLNAASIRLAAAPGEQLDLDVGGNCHDLLSALDGSAAAIEFGSGLAAARDGVSAGIAEQCRRTDRQSMKPRSVGAVGQCGESHCDQESGEHQRGDQFEQEVAVGGAAGWRRRVTSW